MGWIPSALPPQLGDESGVAKEALVLMSRMLFLLLVLLPLLLLLVLMIFVALLLMTLLPAARPGIRGDCTRTIILSILYSESCRSYSFLSTVYRVDMCKCRVKKKYESSGEQNAAFPSFPRVFSLPFFSFIFFPSLVSFSSFPCDNDSGPIRYLSEKKNNTN